MDSYTVELLVAGKVVAVKLAAERVAARSICVAESGGTRDHGISTDICEELDRLAR